MASVFDQAFSLDADERRSFLDRECDRDVELRTQVEQMLRAADAPEAFFDASEFVPPPHPDTPVAPSDDERDEVRTPTVNPATAAPVAQTVALRASRRWVGVGTVVLLAALGGATALVWQTREASSQAANAERRLGDAHALARAMLARYLDAIDSLAPSKAVREPFVRDGLTSLDQLVAQRVDDRAVQLALAEAYRRSAGLQVGDHAGALGDTAGAIASLRKAVAILDPLMQQESKDTDARDGLVRALRALGPLLRQTGDLREARAVMERVVGPVGELPGSDARDPERALTLQQQHHDLGQLLVALGDTAAARRELNTALAALDAIPDRARRTGAVRGAYAVTLQALADLDALAGQPALAAQTASRVVALRQAIVAIEPANSAHQRALGLAFEREGERLANLGRYPDAMRSYRSAAQLAESLLRGERTNLQYRADAARALARLGDMASLAGDVETAITQFRSSLALHRQGQGRDTASAAVRVATIDAQARLARSHARLQQTTEALAELARTESAMDGTRLDSSDVATRSAFGDTYVSLAESYLTLRGQGAADPLAAGICRKAGRMFDRAEALLADLLTRERASARDSSRLIASRSLRASARTQCPAS